VRGNLASQAERFFNEVFRRKAANGTYCDNISRKIVLAIIEDPDLILNLINATNSANRLVVHSVHSSILASMLGIAFNYDSRQVFELTYATFLHDVGMLRIPDEIVNKKGPLTNYERLEIHRHTIYGLRLLEKIRPHIPSVVPFVVYQSHESPDGSGYPHRRKDVFIHSYAKIVATADHYTAMTQDRPYRSPHIPYKAIEIILKLGAK